MVILLPFLKYLFLLCYSAFGEFVTCKYLHVSQDCGHDAARFLQEHLDRISSNLIHEHCAHYTYASDACVQVSGSLQNQISNSFLLLSGLIINFLYVYILKCSTIWMEFYGFTQIKICCVCICYFCKSIFKLHNCFVPTTSSTLIQ